MDQGFASMYEDIAFLRGRACAGLPITIFYPDRGHRYTEAVKVCASCPVSEKCAVYNLDDETNAYVARMTPTQRAQRRKGLRKKAS